MTNFFKELVPAGRWEISGFHYGKSNCQCCGRLISRVLHLKNKVHQAKLDKDPTYRFSEEIHVGIVCGPKIFKSSCSAFYEDPEMEWARQFDAIKDYIDWIIVCALNRDIWDMVPEMLRTAIDRYIDNGAANEEHSGGWTRIKYAKRRVLKTKRINKEKEPHKYLLWRNSSILLNVAINRGLIESLSLTLDMQLVPGVIQ